MLLGDATYAAPPGGEVDLTDLGQGINQHTNSDHRYRSRGYCGTRAGGNGGHRLWPDWTLKLLLINGFRSGR